MFDHIWQWTQATMRSIEQFAQMIEYDPVEALQARVTRLERELEELRPEISQSDQLRSR